MRSFPIIGMLLALPLMTNPAHAQNNWTDQAQRLLNPDGGHNAYERGRQDQARQEELRRDQRRADHQRARDPRYNSGYNRY